MKTPDYEKRLGPVIDSETVIDRLDFVIGRIDDLIGYLVRTKDMIQEREKAAVEDRPKNPFKVVKITFQNETIIEFAGEKDKVLEMARDWANEYEIDVLKIEFFDFPVQCKKCLHSWIDPKAEFPGIKCTKNHSSTLAEIYNGCWDWTPVIGRTITE